MNKKKHDDHDAKEHPGLSPEDRRIAAENVKARFESGGPLPPTTSVFDPGLDELAEILSAFGHRGEAAWTAKALDQRGMTHARGGARRETSRAHVADDAVDYWDRFHLEVDGARSSGVLSSTLEKITELRSGTLLAPAEYATRWQELVHGWNDALDMRAYVRIPRLCESCGSPIFRRREQPGEPLSRRCTAKQCTEALRKRERRSKQP